MHLSLVFVAVLIAGAAVLLPAAEIVAIDRAAFADLKVPDDQLTKAMGQKFAFGPKLQNGSQVQAYGLCQNALLVAVNPALTSADGRSVADSVLTQVRSLLKGGSEPNAGGGLNGWTHHAVAAAMVCVRKTPELWSKLSADEQARMDWIMRAMAVAGHFQHDDGNNFTTSLHADDNSQKNWNPNHRLYYYVVLMAAAYFGPDALNADFVAFDWDAYQKKFDEFGFSNIMAAWASYDWKPILEKGGTYISPKTKKANGTGTGVRHPFTYKGLPLSDIAGIFCAQAEYAYGETVTNGIEGKSWILDRSDSPFLGQKGMIMEFNSKDAGGVRSDIGYCTENFQAFTIDLLALKVLGLWKKDDRCRNVEKLMYVGNEDFLYKERVGFHSFSKGKGHDSKKADTVPWLGYTYVLALWNGYLKERMAK